MSFRAIIEEGRRLHRAALAEERAVREREAQFSEAQEICRRVAGRGVLDWIAASWARAMRAAAPDFDPRGSEDQGEKKDKDKDEKKYKPDGPPLKPPRRRWRRRGHGAASADGWGEAMEAVAPDEAAAPLEAGSRIVVTRPDAPALRQGAGSQ